MQTLVEIKVLDEALYEFGGLPKPATELASASDLVALSVFEKTKDGKPNLKSSKPIEESGLYLPALETAYVGVGFAMSIMDPNYGAFIIPRSSSSALSIALGNTVGLVDPDYQGPVLVAILNRGRSDIKITRGERIAQMYFTPIVRPTWAVVEEFSAKTARADGGFGSTGRV